MTENELKFKIKKYIFHPNNLDSTCVSQWQYSLDSWPSFNYYYMHFGSQSVAAASVQHETNDSVYSMSQGLILHLTLWISEMVLAFRLAGWGAEVGWLGC